MVLKPLNYVLLKGVPVESIGSANYGHNPRDYIRVRVIGYENGQAALARLVLTGELVKKFGEGGADTYWFMKGQHRSCVALDSHKLKTVILYTSGIEELETYLEIKNG